MILRRGKKMPFGGGGKKDVMFNRDVEPGMSGVKKSGSKMPMAENAGAEVKTKRTGGRGKKRAPGKRM